METHSDETITEANARNLPATILNLKVTDSRTYELMANGIQLLNKAWQFFEDRARPRINDAYKLHHNLLADLKKDHDPINDALKYGKKQLGDYDSEQERIAKIEQQRLEAEAKEREELERMQLAELAERAGNKELAEEIISTPSPEPVVVVSKDVPQVQGLSFREDWKFEITNRQIIPFKYHRLTQNPKGEWRCECLADIGRSATAKRYRQESRCSRIFR